MNITCIHCDKQFSITAGQLGTRGKCPHCRGLIELPKAEQPFSGSREHQKPGQWLERSYSGVGSLIVHLVVLVALALIPWGGRSGSSDSTGDVVRIANLDRQPLNTDPAQWEAQQLQSQQRSFDASPIESPVDSWSRETAAVDLEIQLPSAAGNSLRDLTFQPPGGQDVGDVAGRDFNELITRLQQDGLDIVITFDSTASMEGEIRQVKSKIERIGAALFKLVPKTRISICTYRDDGDQYVVQGLKLTDNLGKIAEYLQSISAGGGGDEPEAVDEGLSWAINQNTFRPRARKVVLLFGDAPPHPSRKRACLTLAGNFRRQQNGTVSTVTCHNEEPLVDFVEIAQVGGGESFLTQDDREIMTQLMVLVFGSRHRGKVIEALDLMQR